MQLKHLESYQNSVTDDLWALLHNCLKEGSWSRLLAYTKETLKSSDSLSRAFSLYDIYELALEYAIFREADSFIEASINHAEVVSHVNHSILFSCSRKFSDSLQEKAVAAMVNNLPEGFGSFANLERELTKITYSAKEQCTKSQFQSFSIPDADLKFIRQFLRNRNISLDKKIFSFRSWVYLYWHVAQHCTNNKQLIVELDQIFYACLPEDAESVFPVLGMLVAAYEVDKMESGYLRQLIASFLNRYNFNSDQIVLALESDEMSRHLLENIDLLATRIQPTHPAFSRYDILRQIITMQSDARTKFIIDNDGIITQITKPYRLFHDFRTQYLTPANKRALLAWYIQHSDFKFGAILNLEFASFDETLAVQYLTATHTALPHKPLTVLVSSKLRQKAKAITSLITRSDFQLSIDELVGALNHSIEAGDVDALTALLENTNIYEILKNYYTLDGDGYLSREERGTVLPTALAWYVRSDQFEELFSSYTEEQQKVLIKSIVRPGLDANRPTLHAYVMQSGNKKLIALFGGPEPRLMRQTEGKQYTAFIPDFWRNQKALSSLQKFQRQTVVKIAKKKSVYFRVDKATISEVAKSAAAACPIQLFHLLHQTDTANLQAILQASLLQIRQHTQGRSITGKYSAGLMPAQHGLGVLSLFCYFTKQPWGTGLQEGLALFSRENKNPSSGISFNLFQLLSENPQINFILIGPSHETPTKRLTIQGFMLESLPVEKEGLWTRKVKFNNPTQGLQRIAQVLFELVLDKLVSKLPGELQAEVIQRLTKPQTENDYKLARDLIDLLHLEWLVPGDIPLKFSYVDQVQYGAERYHLVKLRNLVMQGSESDVLRAIENEESIKRLSFVVTGIINIAIQRGFKQVVKTLTQRTKTNKPEIKIAYYPPEVYQIEAVIQQILEDPNNTRTYVTYLNSILTINTVRQLDSNRNCSHHAEMAKLHHALGIGNLIGQNALQIVLPDTLEVPIGEGGICSSLTAMRDKLLTYELATLLVSMQNRRYYQNHNGTFHPITGKGATNGTVALLPDRLFNDDGPYRINISYDITGKQLQLSTSRSNTLAFITTELQALLNISSEKVSINENVITITIPVTDLIAKLRRQAVFYNGINVLTEDGRLLLAYRHGKGLASSGGHHCDKYDRKGIVYSLRSEFGLALRNAKNLEQAIVMLNPTKKLEETGIFVVHEQDLTSIKEGQKVANFTADPDEFDRGSEVALTLTQMRGKKFYDVMPLESLSLYQLNLLKAYLRDSGHHWSVAINTEVETMLCNNVFYKVPKEFFGQMILVSETPLPDQLTEKFVCLESVDSKYVYQTDESPLAILNIMRNTSNLRLTC